MQGSLWSIDARCVYVHCEAMNKVQDKTDKNSAVRLVLLGQACLEAVQGLGCGDGCWQLVPCTYGCWEKAVPV